MIRVVFGTRPEIIKLEPLLRALRARHIAFEVLFTGQHPDLVRGLDQLVDHHLAVPSDNDPEAYVARATAACIRSRLVYANLVIVQGDTASALAGAKAAAFHRIPVAHVEAGLRSHHFEDPWPEEGYRVAIDRLATHRYCPTEGNLANLRAETLDGLVTGNTITDAIRHTQLVRDPGNHVLVTLHRRESFGKPLEAILQGLADAANEHPTTPFTWPVHPNPHIQTAIHSLALPPNVTLCPPLPYYHFLALLRTAKAVLTDSGGVCEEACTLGVPTVIARNHTERGECLGLTAHLAGTFRESVARELDWALHASVHPSTIFGDGYAADTIANHIAPLVKKGASPWRNL